MSKEQADKIIKLGKLLKKNRPKQFQKQVDKIANEDLTYEQKVDRIRAIDKKIEKLKHEKSSDRKKQIIDKSRDALNKLQKPINDIKHNIKKIIPSKFFSYLFTHRSKIKHFGSVTKTVKPKFLSLHFNITDEAKILLTRLIWDNIYLIMKPMNYIIREGWKKLNKFQYNLVVNFVFLIDEYYKHDFRNFKPEDVKTFSRIKTIQTLLFNGMQDEVHREQLYYSIERIFSEHEIYKKSIPDYIKAARSILEPNLLKPSLVNIFLASNMVNYRKFISFKELLVNENVKPVPKESFLCSETIQYKMKTFISDLKLRLEKLEDEALIIKVLKETYKVTNDEIEQDYSILKLMFNTENPEIASNEDDLIFEDIQRDMISVLKRLFINFLFIYEPLFNDKTLIKEQEDPIKILPYDIINNQVYLMRTSLERLNRFMASHTFTKIYLADYNEFFKTGKTPYESEIEFFQLVEDMSNSLFFLGKEIAYLVENTDTQLKKNLTRSLPLAHKKIDNNILFEDKTVIEYLKSVAQFSFAFCQFFKNYKLKILLNGEEKVNLEIEQIKGTLKRIE